ncbi:MAG: hypothetical protein JXA03_06310 [Bacteroidales bacterium]|nr:hypothetical protein [Bacteroidales bacterium]
MLVRNFRNSYTLNHILFWIAGLLLWLPAFLHPEVVSLQENSLLTGHILKWFEKLPLVSTLFALLLLFFEAYYLNYVLIGNNIVPRNSIFTAFIYFLLMSSDKSLLTLHPVLAANLFLMPALNHILKIYMQENAFATVFNIGFLTALASFFLAPSVWLIFFIWLTFIVYRIVSWREWLISLTGYVLPYLFLFTWLFWTDSAGLMSEMAGEAVSVRSNLVFPSGMIRIAIITGLILLLLWTFLGLFDKITEQKISIRKKIWSFIWLIAVSLFSILWMGGLPFHLSIAITFAAIAGISSFYVLHLRKMFFYEMLVNLLTLLILINNLFL